MVNLKLRKAAASDSEFAYQVKKAAFRTYVDQVCGWVEEEQRRLHDRRFGAHETFIIECEGLDVGFLALERDREWVNLHQLFLLPEHQGKGIGAACTRTVLDDAKKAGILVRLQVLKVNQRAHEFFLGLGFSQIGENDTHNLLAWQAAE